MSVLLPDSKTSWRVFDKACSCSKKRVVDSHVLTTQYQSFSEWNEGDAKNYKKARVSER